MRLIILSKLKSKIFNFNFSSNYDFLLLLIAFCFFWSSIGQYVELSNLFNTIKSTSNRNLNFGFFDVIGIIHFLLFFILLSILIFKLIENKKISIFIILLIYPLSASAGYFFNIKAHENLGLLLHYFFTISNLILFFAIISYLKNKEKIVEIFLNISFFFIIVFFILLIIPDLYNRVLNNIHVRDVYYVKLNLLLFEYSYIQNSNGASRITLIILLILFTNLIYNIKNNIIYNRLFFLIFLISIIFFYYQSRINIIFYILYLFSWCFFSKKIKLKNKIYLIIFFTIIPFLSINFYNNNILTIEKKINENYYFRYQKEQIIEKNSFVKLLNVFNLKNKNFNFELNENRMLMADSVNDQNAVVICETTDRIRLLKSIDSYSSGRVCGWEILIRDINKENILFGKGFFYDQIFLKKYQKLSSNTYINIIYNSGIIGFSSILIFIILVSTNIKKIVKLTKHSNLKFNLSIYIIIYLSLRSLFEDTLAFTSIDLILFLNCLTLVLFKVNKLNKNKNVKKNN